MRVHFNTCVDNKKSSIYKKKTDTIELIAVVLLAGKYSI